jgi:nickel-type superoxide dismutase maturation protease
MGIGSHLTTVRIIGPSMEPALRTGDCWVVRLGARVSPGDVVFAVHPLRPDLRIVKRAIRQEGTGWWIEGDNPDSSDDSRSFGPVDTVLGTLIFRYSPLFRRG